MNKIISDVINAREGKGQVRVLGPQGLGQRWGLGGLEGLVFEILSHARGITTSR